MTNGACITMKSFSGSFLILLLMTAVAFGHLNVSLPFAAIEYDATEAVQLHGSAESFSKTTPILLNDVQSGDGTYWLSKTVTGLSTLRGYAHVGGSHHAGQAFANGLVTHIQIWKWADSNGNGRADEGDDATQWTKVVELKPSADEGNVVGYEIDNPIPEGEPETSTWQGDLLQGRTIELTPGKSFLLLIRVVDTAGNVNLMDALDGTEQWDNGVTNDLIGSDVAADKYIDADGNTPGQTDGRVADKQIVWVYVNRGR